MQTDSPRVSRDTQGLFRVVAENLHELVAVLDTQGKRLFNSPSYAQILDNPSNLIGTDSFADIHPDDRGMVKDAFFETVQTGTGKTVEYRLLTHDGSVRLIESHGSVMRDSSGAIGNVVVVSRDITELRAQEKEREQLQQQLRQAQKMEDIGTLTSGVAHDFNNILAIILGYATMLETNRIPSDGLPKAYANIRMATERGTALVKQLMAFARRTDINILPLSINQIINDLTTILNATFPKTIPIQTSLDPDLPAVVADSGQIHQALLNICVNARDAMPHGGVLRISTSVADKNIITSLGLQEVPDKYALIEISDTGIGMDKKTKSRIFEPFFTTKEPGKGTGLGLSVVYGVVRAHEGLVEVQSQPGKGTTFSIFLPSETTTQERAEATPQAKDLGLPRGSETILVVEDEVMLLGLVKSLLASSGYTVLTAASGREAVETYRNHAKNVAVVISDLGLPELNGWDAFIRMRELNPKITAIFATGFIEEQVKKEMLQMGVYAVIDKPYIPTQLLRVLRAAIDSH